MLLYCRNVNYGKIDNHETLSVGFQSLVSPLCRSLLFVQFHCSRKLRSVPLELWHIYPFQFIQSRLASRSFLSTIIITWIFLSCFCSLKIFIYMRHLQRMVQWYIITVIIIQISFLSISGGLVAQSYSERIKAQQTNQYIWDARYIFRICTGGSSLRRRLYRLIAIQWWSL